uniref:3FTx-Ver-124 n=1 Tax=Vermicella annulata TaxID=1295044 RepID=R4G354_9SAUR
MKTLLLTMVVVTIVCLDLGYTLKCHKSHLDKGYVVCKEHETICFEYRACIFRNEVLYIRGCSASCPGGYKHVCCSTDLCNK